jgi:hypothetical protein
MVGWDYKKGCYRAVLTKGRSGNPKAPRFEEIGVCVRTDSNVLVRTNVSSSINLMSQLAKMDWIELFGTKWRKARQLDYLMSRKTRKRLTN